MRTLCRGRSWLLPKMQFSLAVILLGLLAAASPANADTIYTFQGTTLHEGRNVGWIPGCVGGYDFCFGKLWDGDEVGAITGQRVLVGSPVNGPVRVTFLSLSFNRKTINSNDATFSASDSSIVELENGNIARLGHEYQQGRSYHP